MWPYDPVGGALDGGAMVWSSALGSWTVLKGTRPGPGNPLGEAHRLVRFEHRWGGSLGAFLLDMGPGAGQWSLAIRSTGRKIAGAMEWAGGEGTAHPDRYLGTIRWEPGTGVMVEGEAGASGGRVEPTLGMRPQVLDSWLGRGWALRLAMRPGPEYRLRVLVCARTSDPAGEDPRRNSTLIDALLDGRQARHWEWQLRWRRQGDRTWDRAAGWSWLPDQPGSLGEVTTFLCQIRRRFAVGWIKSGLRARSVAGSERDGTRLAWTWGCVWRGRPGLTLRLQQDTAWGDDVDLVTVINPLQGYLVPRHWAAWKNQAVVGVGWEPGRWRVQAGTAIRTPAPPTRSQELQLWMEAGCRW